MPASTILGCWRHLPPRRVTNDELARELGTTADAVAAVAGIAERRRADAGLGPSDLGREAALDALRRASLGPEEVDLIVFATMTPDIAFPGAGCFLQHKLGCRTVGALDVWIRPTPGTRRPRFTRDEIAQTAIEIADTEGFDAVSMRRIATELDAGTMTP